jgi:hypothetical protein
MCSIHFSAQLVDAEEAIMPVSKRDEEQQWNGASPGQVQ